MKPLSDSRNEELPRDFRLSDDLFQMTTFTYNDIRAKTEEKLNLVSIFIVTKLFINLKVL
jgi:hypothetical protein